MFLNIFPITIKYDFKKIYTVGIGYSDIQEISTNWLL